MEIIPAIDILGGKCVRLAKGDYNSVVVYSDNPLATAIAFQDIGIQKIRVVDLDGARVGEVKNWGVIETLAQRTKLTLQIGGGFHTKDDIARVLGLGNHQVSLGTVAVKEPEKFRAFLLTFGPDRIVADVAFQDGKVFTHGWQVEEQLETRPVLAQFLLLGTKEVICTDISRDGTLAGPNTAFYETTTKEFPELRIIAAGGVRTVKDIKDLSHTGVAGVIVGKALYEKTITLQDLASLL